MAETRLERRRRLVKDGLSPLSKAVLAFDVALDADEPPLRSYEVAPLLLRLRAFEQRELADKRRGELNRLIRRRESLARKAKASPSPRWNRQLDRIERRIETAARAWAEAHAQMNAFEHVLRPRLSVSGGDERR